MWPFRRKADDRSATLTYAAAPAPAHAWRDLPPIQRLTDDLTPVTEPDRFQDSLTTWKSPGLLEPLGHYVTASAPSGVVHEVPTHSVHQFAGPPLVARMLSTRAPATIATPAVPSSPPPVSRPDKPTTIAMPTVSPSPPQAPRPATPPPVDRVLPIVDEPAVARSPIEPSPSPEMAETDAETSAIVADYPHPTDESTEPEVADHEHRSDVAEAFTAESTEVQRLAESPLVGETATSTPIVEAVPKGRAASGTVPKRIGLGLPISRSVDSPPPIARPSGVLGQPRSEPAVVQPMTEFAVVQPMTESAVVQPVPESAAVQPVPESAVVQPRVETAVVQRVPESAAVQPVPESAVVQPRVESAVVQPIEVQHRGPEPSQPAEASPQLIVQRSTSAADVVTDRGDEPVEQPGDDADPSVDVSEGVRPTLGVDSEEDQPAPLATTQPDPSPHVEPPVVGPRAAIEQTRMEQPEANLSGAENATPPLASPMPVASRQAEDRPPGATPTGSEEMQLPEQPSASEVTAPLVGDPTATIAPTVQEEPSTTPVARADDPGLDWIHAPIEHPLGVPAAPTPVSAFTPSMSIQLERSPGDLVSQHPTTEPAGRLPTPGMPATPDTADMTAGEPSEDRTAEPLRLVPTLGMPAIPGPAGPTPIVARASDATPIRLPSGATDSSRPLPTFGDHGAILTPLTIARAATPAAAVQRRVESPATRSVLRTPFPVAPNYAGTGAATRPFQGQGMVWQLSHGDDLDRDVAGGVVAQRGVDESVAIHTTAVESAGNEVEPGDDIGSDTIVQRATGATTASTGAGGASPGGAGADLDELARKLYGRIRVHLRNELRLDRERAGSLVETRR